jgi:hypothetical protein
VRFLFLALFFLSSCSSRSAMTRENFDSIPLGTPLCTVTSMAGDPYSVRSLGNGAFEYEYIERITLGQELMAENHYFFKVKDGQVVAKKMKMEKQPAYDLIYQQDPNYPEFP